MPTLVNNLRAIRGPVTAVPVTAGSGIEIATDTENNQIVISSNLEAGSGIEIVDDNGKAKIINSDNAQALPIVAGTGVKLSVVNNQVVVSADETVLWSGALTVGNTAHLSEPITAFERYKFYLLGHERYLKVVNEFWTDGSSAGNEPYKVNPVIFQAGAGFFTINAGDCKWNTTWDNLEYVAGYNKWMPYNSSNWNQINTDTDSPIIVKIVGINRIANN